MSKVTCCKTGSLNLNCGHTGRKLCFQTLDLSNITCCKPVLIDLVCGHEAKKLCFQRSKCINICCREPCSRVCPHGHPCRKRCSEKCPPCNRDVEDVLTCGECMQSHVTRRKCTDTPGMCFKRNDSNPDLCYSCALHKSVDYPRFV